MVSEREVESVYLGDSFGTPNCGKTIINFLGQKTYSSGARRNAVKITMIDIKGNRVWQFFTVETLLQALEEYKDR